MKETLNRRNRFAKMATGIGIFTILTAVPYATIGVTTAGKKAEQAFPDTSSQGQIVQAINVVDEKNKILMQRREHELNLQGQTLINAYAMAEGGALLGLGGIIWLSVTRPRGKKESVGQ